MALHQETRPVPGTPGGEPPPPTLDFLEKQLQEEFSTKQSLEARGLAVVTTAATLATLSFGIAKFATPGGGGLNGFPGWTLLAAFLGFVLAAVGGLVANWPFKKYSAITANGLDDVVSKERWLKAPDDVRWMLARTIVEMIKAAKGGNSLKAGWLIAAMICELVAVVALALTAAQLIRT